VRRMMALVAVSSLILAACGGSSDAPDPSADPKDSLIDALQAMGELPGVSMTLSLATTEDDLIALAANDGDTLTPEQASAFVESSLTVQSVNEADPAKQQMAISANIAGIENAVQLSVIGDSLYARADVRGLAAEFGADTSSIDQMVGQAPPGFEFIGTAVEGGWVGMTGLNALAQQFGAPPPASDEESEAAAKKFAETMSKALSENSEVTFEGDEAPGDHLVATVAIRGIYEDFISSLGALGGAFTGGMGEIPPASEIPDIDVQIDFWVADGQVTQILFDFLKIAEAASDEEIPSGVEQMGLLIGLDEFGDEITPPSDYAEIDLQTLMQGFMGGMTTGGTGMETGTEVPVDFCEQLAEAPEDVQAQFEAECPELAG
jgi:hypothetical protein